MDDAISRSALIRAISQKIKEVEDPFPDKFDLGCRAGLSVAKKYVEEAPAINEPLGAAPPKWISVEERLPENGEIVIIRIKRRPGVTYYAVAERDGVISSGWYTNDEDFNSGWGSPKVTHWMQFPKLPKEENK